MTVVLCNYITLTYYTLSLSLFLPLSSFLSFSFSRYPPSSHLPLARPLTHSLNLYLSPTLMLLWNISSSIIQSWLMRCQRFCAPTFLKRVSLKSLNCEGASCFCSHTCYVVRACVDTVSQHEQCVTVFRLLNFLHTNSPICVLESLTQP